MKRNLLFILFALVYTIGNAQVVFYIQPPSDLEGNYEFNYATADNAWGVGDLEDPANAIVGELAMALDGSADSDSLVCEAPVISDVDGKIAVVYRGACEFGYKAIACQTAGAIGVIIINNVTDDLIGILGGDSGMAVTIPVIITTMATGANIRDQVLAGGLTAFIGNKTGFYDDDLGIKANGVIRAPRASNIQLLSQDETEFESQLGCWITNFGSNDQTNVVLSATIVLDGSELYNESGTAIDILSGDSAFVSLPTFSQTSYDLGLYNMTYSVESDVVDEFPSDDTYIANFRMSENLYSYGDVLDEVEGPVNSIYYRPDAPQGEIQQCVAFQDANASRVAVTGLTFSASTNAETIDGETVSIYLYEWTLQFMDLDDPDYTGVDEIDLDLLASGLYEFDGGDLENENVFQAFEEVLVLDDDARYLFCIAYESEDMFVGYNGPKLDYGQNLDTYLQPQFPNTSGAEWFLVGFGTDITPGIAVHMVDANATSVEEVTVNNDITPYPNPAQDFIQIPLNDVSGLTTVQIFDVAGKLVETQSISVTPGELLQFNVSNLENGIYTFGLRYENGNVSNFNVVIAK